MKRDLAPSAFRQFEQASIIDRWCERGAEDSRRHFPSTAAGVGEVVRRITGETIETAKLELTGAYRIEVAKLFAKVNVEAVAAEDVAKDIRSATFDCANRLHGRTNSARAELASAQERCRETTEALQKFKRNHPEVADRDPAPRPTWWQRLLIAWGHFFLAALAGFVEIGSFLFLGHETPAQALAFGIIGGGVTALLLACLHHSMVSGRARHTLGSRRHNIGIAILMLVISAFSYGMAAVRDSLLRINNGEDAVTLADILVAPGDLSPEGGMVWALTTAIMIATWLGSLGRRDFGPEDEFRDLHEARESADAAYRAVVGAVQADVEAIIGDGHKVFDTIQEKHNDARIASAIALGEAQKRLGELQSAVQDACRLAADTLRAYATANEDARAMGNPLPDVIWSVTFDPGLGVERDLFDGFKRNLTHARKLEAEAKAVQGQARVALAQYSYAIEVFLGALFRDPGTPDQPPRFDLLLSGLAGPVFDPPDSGRNETPGDVIRRFLGL